ncbi:flagellar hook-length control protein FliK [Hyphococcus sp.]|uniref:flagellar hook-length control protein FliK n=1 Tax=Hyphococcus sp. TaxID=2038636 RepID=UPI003D0A99BD
MENMQLSLLTALFGGKPSGDALVLEKTLNDDGEAQTNPQGFFSFLQGLLSATPDADEQTLNAPEGAAAKKSFHGLNAEKLRALLADTASEAGAETGDLEIAAARFEALPVTALPAEAPAASDIISRLSDGGALAETPLSGAKAKEVLAPVATAETALPIAAAAPFAGDANTPQGTAPAAIASASPSPATVAPAAEGPPAAPSPYRPLVTEDAPAEARLPDNEGDERGLLVRTAKPAHAAAPAEIMDQAATVVAAKPGQAQPAANPGAPIEAETVAVDIVEADMLPEPGMGDRETRADDLFSRAPQNMSWKTTSGPANASANAVAALTEHASPDALAHSAVTRDEAAGATEIERVVTARTEAAVHAAERNAHLAPMRDQIIAAVAARPGDSRLEIRLDPPELGRVMIGFEKDGTDIVRAVVTADSPDTLDLMRRNADVFQRALEQQGFSNLDLHFADKGAREHSGESAGETPRLFSLAEDGAVTAAASSQHQGLVNGRLDRRL